MRALTSGELLSVWEWGQGRNVLERGLALLTATAPGETADELLGLSIGRRDERLLTLRETLFGSGLEGQVSCPACGDRLELAFGTTDLRSLLPSLPPASDAGEPFEWNEWSVRFRLPNSRDLLAATALPNPDAARRELLRRCVLAVSPPGEETASALDGDLPAGLEAALCDQVERLDAGATPTVELTCPTCRHVWTVPFDILSYLWEEIDAWAYRTLRDVHLLASAYGWREADILALSPWRRQAYLQMSDHA